MLVKTAVRQKVAAIFVLAVLTTVFSTLVLAPGLAGEITESDDEHTWRPKCDNSAFNQFYFEETDGPTNGDVQSGFVSNPPSAFVVSLVGPAKEFGEGDTWTYHYESNTNDWYIWRVVFQPGNTELMARSGAQAQGVSEPIVIQDGAQRGTLQAPEGTGSPQWVVFCLVEAGSITIKQNTSPDDPQNFTFTGSPSPLTGFTIDDDPSNGSLPSSRNQVVPVRTPTGGVIGPYVVTQAAVAGWPLTSITCSGELGDPATEDTTNRTVSIPLEWREDILCTFTNTKPGALNSNGSVQGAGAAAEAGAGVLATTGAPLSGIQGTGVALLLSAGLMVLMIRRARQV